MCMYVYMYIYIYIYTRTYIHIDINNMCVYIYIYIYIGGAVSVHGFPAKVVTWHRSGALDPSLLLSNHRPWVPLARASWGKTGRPLSLSLSLGNPICAVQGSPYASSSSRYCPLPHRPLIP